MKSLSNQMLDQADTMMQSLLKPRERRIYCDEFAFADRASWLDAHQITEDRRKPINIATVNNHSAECLSLIVAAGECTCGGVE